MRENPMDELARHFCGGLGKIVERGDDREDGRAGVGGELHVAQVDAVEWRFADTEDEGAALLSFLRSHAAKPDYQFRHRWSAGDLVVWDNRSVWHAAIDDYGDAERWGYKTAVLGNWRPA